jgi:hypothetical protein
MKRRVRCYEDRVGVNAFHNVGFPIFSEIVGGSGREFAFECLQRVQAALRLSTLVAILAEHFLDLCVYRLSLLRDMLEAYLPRMLLDRYSLHESVLPGAVLLQ